MKKLFLITFTTLFFSCSFNQKENTKTTGVKVDIAKQKDIAQFDNELNVEVGQFSSIPDTIDGCGDFYSFEIQKGTKKTYVFLSNLTDFSMMKLNGKTEYFKINQESVSNTSDTNYSQTAVSEKYKLNCDFHLIKKYDEGGSYKLKLTLIDLSTNKKKTIILTGESGC